MMWLRRAGYSTGSGNISKQLFWHFQHFHEPSEDGLFYIGSTGDEGSSDFTLLTFNPSTGFVDEISNQTEFMSKISNWDQWAAAEPLIDLLNFDSV